MTLAQERAAIRSGVASSRASTFKRDLNSLETSRRQTQVLNTLERKGLRAATRGRGLWNEKTRQGAGTGGGIASPVTEPSFDARQWWDDGWKTSDGLFTIPMPKKLVMRDANNAEVVFEFANPAPVPAP